MEMNEYCGLCVFFNLPFDIEFDNIIKIKGKCEKHIEKGCIMWNHKTCDNYTLMPYEKILREAYSYFEWSMENIDEKGVNNEQN